MTKEFDVKCFTDEKGDGFVVRVFGTCSEPWFLLNDIAAVLEHKNAHMVFNRMDIPGDWKKLVTMNSRECTLINEFALYKFIMKSTKPNAVKFQNFVCSEVLPSIRKTGKYEMEKRVQDDERTIRLNIYNTVHNVFTSLGMDDRDRLMFKDYGRDLMITDGRQPLQEMSISRRVKEKHAHNACKRHTLITIGKEMAKRYRELHEGEDPLKREQFVDGTTRMVSHYTVDDYEEWGDIIIARILNRLITKQN
jgi:prophage antirepressor-like protein